MTRRDLLKVATAFALQSGFGGSVARAQMAKSLTLVIGSGEGVGAIDLCARALGVVLPKYLSGLSKVVPSQMPGAGGMTALNYLENIAASDGLTWAFPPRSVVLAPYLYPEQAKFDPRKLHWIGSPTDSPTVGVVFADHTQARDLTYAARDSLIVGATSPNQDNHFLPRALNQYFGTRFKVIGGYRSPADIELALERGEIQGLIGTSWAALQTGRSAQWLKEGKLIPIAQFGEKRHAQLPDLPTYAEQLGGQAEARQLITFLLSANMMGYPACVGSRTPASLVADYRRAFQDTIRDEQYVSLTKAIGTDRQPITGEELQNIVEKIYAIPEQVVQRAQALVNAS